LFAADKVVGGNKPTKDLQMPQNLLNRRLSGSRSVAEEVFLIFLNLRISSKHDNLIILIQKSES